MIYAVFYQEAADDNGECVKSNAAFGVLSRALGKFAVEWAGGQDNSWNCDAVDSEDKVFALKLAHPNEEVFELNSVNYRKWSRVFGEFDPEGTAEDWYNHFGCS